MGVVSFWFTKSFERVRLFSFRDEMPFCQMIQASDNQCNQVHAGRTTPLVAISLAKHQFIGRETANESTMARR